MQDALNLAEGRGDVYQEEPIDVSSDSDVEYVKIFFLICWDNFPFLLHVLMSFCLIKTTAHIENVARVFSV